MRNYFLRISVWLLVCHAAIEKSTAQSLNFANGKFEVGAGIGPSFFLGDLGGTQGIGRPFVKDVNFPYTKLMLGLHFNYYPAEWIGIRLAGNLGHLEADDSIINNKGGAEEYRKERNLNFRSKLKEVYLALEIYPFQLFSREGYEPGKLRPYGLIGAGLFHFNPQGRYYDANGNTQWVYLRPLRTEGQGMSEYPEREEYSLTQVEIPMGFGFKYYFKPSMYVGFEVLHRKTFTDYIDDVSTTYIDPVKFDQYLSPAQAGMATQMHYRENFLTPTSRPFLGEQRGDPTENDAFFSTVIRFGWRLNADDNPNKNIRKQMRCPVFY